MPKEHIVSFSGFRIFLKMSWVKGTSESQVGGLKDIWYDNKTYQTFLLAPKELYTWYCPMTIQPLFEHTPVLNNNFEYWCHDDFVDCDFYDD